MKVRRALGMTAVLLGFALAACGVPEDPEAGGETKADSTRTDSLGKQPEAQVAAAVPVETARAVAGPISAFLPFDSTIKTEASVEIFPRISGLVEAVEVEEGDRVTAGQALLQLEDEELGLAVRESEVNLRHLEASFERTEEMFRRKLLSDQDYENGRYELEQARLRRERARMELQHATVRAPFAGVITERHVQLGSRVAPGARLFGLIKLDEMIAEVFIPGQHLAEVEVGQRAVVTSEFLGGAEFGGRVKRISPVVDPGSGTFRVTVGLEDPGEHLRPGIFVNVHIITATHESAVLVPKEAVVYDGRDRYVFAVADTVASRIKLDPGFENASFVEALSLVEAGTPVIVVGQEGLRDGARVRVVDQDNDPEPADSPPRPDPQ